MFHSIKRTAERSHKPCNCGTDNVPAKLQLKGTENRVVKESSSLHNNVSTQFVNGFRTDYLVNGVLDDRSGKSRGNILNGSAVLLRLLYGAVHKNSTTRTQVNGTFRKKSKL